MTAGELSLGRRLNLNVPIVVLNDGWLSLMQVKQERKGYELSGVRLGEPPPIPAALLRRAVPRRQTPEELRRGAGVGAVASTAPASIEAFIDAAPYSATVFD